MVETSPDVVLMDLGMPELGGIEATERIVAADPGIRVIVITLYDDPQSVRAALDAGLLSRGLSNPVIAERLHLSVKTVANYVSIILLKVGAEDRTTAAAVLRDRRVTGM